MQHIAYVIGMSQAIGDKASPFNVGRAVSLAGFQPHEAEPLAQGLSDLGDAQALLQAVLY